MNEGHICEAEALLANLKNRRITAHRYNSENELLKEDEVNLSAESEPDATFDE